MVLLATVCEGDVTGHVYQIRSENGAPDYRFTFAELPTVYGIPDFLDVLRAIGRMEKFTAQHREARFAASGSLFEQ